MDQQEQAVVGPKMGTKELKDVLDLVLTTVEVGKLALADGKVGIEDMGLLLKLIPAVGPAIQGVNMVPAELADMDEAEAAEVVAHVMAKLTIDDAKARAVIAASLKTLIAGYELVKSLKA